MVVWEVNFLSIQRPLLSPDVCHSVSPILATKVSCSFLWTRVTKVKERKKEEEVDNCGQHRCGGHAWLPLVINQRCRDIRGQLVLTSRIYWSMFRFMARPHRWRLTLFLHMRSSFHPVSFIFLFSFYCFFLISFFLYYFYILFFAYFFYSLFPFP